MTFEYFNTKFLCARWKQKQPFTFWYRVNNFYPWKDIVGRKVSKLRSIAQLRAFYGSVRSKLGQGFPEMAKCFVTNRCTGMYREGGRNLHPPSPPRHQWKNNPLFLRVWCIVSIMKTIEHCGKRDEYDIQNHQYVLYVNFTLFAHLVSKRNFSLQTLHHHPKRKQEL